MEELESKLLKFYFDIPGFNHHNSQILFTTWLVMGIIIVLALFARKGIKVMPSGLGCLLEYAVESMYGFVESIMGEKGRIYTPLIGTFAIFILFSNFIGLVPGFVAPTSSLNTTLALALITFFTTHASGFIYKGVFEYLKDFTARIPWQPIPLVIKPILTPLFIVIEVVSHLVRLVSLSMRLFGNMFGKHLVGTVFLSLISGFVVAGLSILCEGINIVLMLPLSVLVCTVQTVVFIVLSMIYIFIAITHEEEGGEH